jgi:hypothetical protein
MVTRLDIRLNPNSSAELPLGQSVGLVAIGALPLHLSDKPEVTLRHRR